jgi:uncharacterized protein
MLQRLPRTAQFLPLLAAAALVAAALVAAGCTPVGLERAPVAEPASTEARRYESARDWPAAAEAWQRAAAAARGPDRDAPLVAAAEAWFRAGDAERARAALAEVSPNPSAEVAARKMLVESRLLLRANRPADALTRLAGVPMGPGDPLASELLVARSDAAFASRQPAIGVAALARRESLLAEPSQRMANQRRIWNRMQESVAAGVSLQTPPGVAPVVSAWLELGQAAEASAGNPYRLRAGLVSWRERHPTHPAATGIVEALLAEYQALTDYPRQVALLLPLSGRQEAAATAVRDGFVAAYLAQGSEGERPAIQVYDTSALGALAAFELAVRNGAEFVVGPLLKEELAQLAAAELPAVPTLALNWADDNVQLPAWMAQFALAPEEEAEAAARRAWEDGHTRAVALVHDTEQGRRMARSFNEAFQAQGGEVLAWQVFEPRVSDFSVEITGLLLLSESRARHQRIQQLAGRNLEYEPRRRQDAEFLFLAARPNEALLLRPQLRFHRAGDLPIYATSSLFDPARNNADLDGVLFADMPWRVGSGGLQFMTQFRAFGPNALERNGRLYAFGADAYRLVPLLHNRSETLGSGVEGLTGTLRVGAAGRVQRELDWGRFEQGAVRPAPPPLRGSAEAAAAGP